MVHLGLHGSLLRSHDLTRCLRCVIKLGSDWWLGSIDQLLLVSNGLFPGVHGHHLDLVWGFVIERDCVGHLLLNRHHGIRNHSIIWLRWIVVSIDQDSRVWVSSFLQRLRQSVREGVRLTIGGFWWLPINWSRRNTGACSCLSSLRQLAERVRMHLVSGHRIVTQVCSWQRQLLSWTVSEHPALLWGTVLTVDSREGRCPLVNWLEHFRWNLPSKLFYLKFIQSVFLILFFHLLGYLSKLALEGFDWLFLPFDLLLKLFLFQDLLLLGQL